MTDDHVTPPPVRTTSPVARTRRRPTWITIALVVGVLALVGFAPAARLAANRLPVRTADPTVAAEGKQRDDTTAVRVLPAGLPPELTIAGIQDIHPYAVAALGVPGAQALEDVLSSDTEVYPTTKPNPTWDWDFGYPYRYAAFDAIIDTAPPDQFKSGATQLAAALIKLAGRPNLELQIRNTAARAAYAVSDRTRTTGGCDTVLNLLLLVAADQSTTMQVLSQEYAHSTDACPDDPTPGWITGQTQMRMTTDEARPRPNRAGDETEAVLAASITTFEGLAERFPNDTRVRTGLGDAYLGAGLRLLTIAPFTARNDLKLAIQQYNRAAELGNPRDVDLGRARAFIGLGDPKRAVELATRATDSARPGVAMEVLLIAQQAAHDMAAAEDVARRLESAGAAAYPGPAVFLAVPRYLGSGLPLPLSTGADTLALLQVLLRPIGAGGATAEDLSFIPQYRDDGAVTATLADCPALAWRRDAVAAGRAGQALTGWPKNFPASRPDMDGCGLGEEGVRAIAELAALKPMSPNNINRSEAYDKWQNLLRWAGDLPAAQRAIARWTAERGDSTALPAHRLAEVTFLEGDYDEAAAQFADAARQARLLHWDDDLGVSEAELGRAAALLKAGRAEEAIPILRQLQQVGLRGYSYRTERHDHFVALAFAAVAYHASVQLADQQSEAGNLHGAVDNYTTALALAPKLIEHGIRPEVVHNNLALAQLGLGDIDRAQASIDQALASDAMNPAFLMSAGFIAERAQNAEQAIDYNRRALHSDPGAFAAANDLGVQLARRHDYGAASAALRQAVGAAPDYALGWFNLGVIESRRGPMHLLASQGAFARANTLDPNLRDRRRELVIDASVYRTALDLSKPLPAKWTLAQTQRAAPAASIGLLTAVLLALGLARATGNQGGDLAKQWLEPLGDRLNGIRGPRWLQRVSVGVIVTVLAFVFTYLRQATSVTEITAYALGVTFIAGVALYARVMVAARRDITVTQLAWPPGMALGLVTGAIGSPWTPLPVTKTATNSRRVHLAAPVVLGGLSLLLLAMAAWLNVPITLALAVAALIMAGSMLLPIEPLDGANLGKSGVIAATGVIAGAVLIALGVG
jgi:Tfp pilus assembly protein PilF